jgi:hypothetical protein
VHLAHGHSLGFEVSLSHASVLNRLYAIADV